VRGDTFIFDNVVHAFDFTEENKEGQVKTPYDPRDIFAGLTYMVDSPLNPVNPDLKKGKTLTPKAGYDYMFNGTEVDMCVAQTVPLFAYFKDGFSPAVTNHEFAAAYPERVVFCGGTDPLWLGLDRALEDLEFQAKEWDAKSFKFYQTQYDRSWRADDEELAYPMWQKALELGVKNVQLHKGIPFAFENIEDLRPNDVQKAARDFPELTFVIHHLGEPFIDESINIAARFPNVWLALSSWVNEYPVMPYDSLHRLGKALQFVGPDCLMWGSESFMAAGVQPFVDLFATVQIPEEFQDHYGYPEFTDEARKAVFGANQARLLGVDVDAKIAELHGKDTEVVA